MNFPDSYNALLVIVIVAGALCVLGVIADYLAERDAPTLRGLAGQSGDPNLRAVLERKQREARERLETERAAAAEAERARLERFWDVVSPNTRSRT